MLEMHPMALRSNCDNFRRMMGGLERNLGPRLRPALWREYWKVLATLEFESHEILADVVITQQEIDLAKKLQHVGKPVTMSYSAKMLWHYFCKSTYNTQLCAAFSVITFSGDIAPSTRTELIRKVNKVLGEYGKSLEASYPLDVVFTPAQRLSRTIKNNNEICATKCLMFDNMREFMAPFHSIAKRHQMFFSWLFERQVHTQSSREIDLGDLDNVSLTSASVPVRHSSAPPSVDLGVTFPDSSDSDSWKGDQQEVPAHTFFYTPPDFVQNEPEDDAIYGPDPFDWESTIPDRMPGGFDELAPEADAPVFRPYPQLLEMISKLTSAAGKAKDSVVGTHALFGETLEAIKTAASPGGIVDTGLIAAASALTVGVGTIDERIASFFSKVPTGTDLKEAVMKYLLPIIVLVCGYLQERHELFKAGFYMGVLALASYWGPWIVEKMSKLSDVVRPQVGGVKFPWLHDAITVLRPVIGIRTYWSTDDVVGSLESAFMYETEVTSELSTIEYILNRAIEAWKAFKRLIGWAEHDYETFVSGYQDVDAFVKDCLPLIEADYCIPNPINVDMVNRLFNMLPVLRVKHEKNPAVQRILNDFAAPLGKIHKEFSQISSRANGLRPEPISLMLYGSPGLGKSTALAMLKPRLMAYMLGGDKKAMEAYECAPDRYVYRRRNEEHWEQCFPTSMIIEYPDFGAMKSNENSSVKHEAEHIQLISCEPYEPHMAFEQKGKLKIKPRYVISSTNNTKVMGETVTHLFAFARRQLFVEQLWAGEGERPVKNAPLNVNDWRFQLAYCDKSTQYAFKHRQDVKAWTFDELSQVLCILDRMSYEKFLKNQNFIQTDTFDGQAMHERVASLAIRPGVEAWDLVRTQSRFTDLMSVKPAEKPLYDSKLGFLDGAFEKVLMKDNQFVTEDTYDSAGINREGIEAFNKKYGPNPMVLTNGTFKLVEEVPQMKPVIERTAQKLVWGSTFPIDGESLKDFQRLFFKDVVSMGDLLFDAGDGFREHAEKLRTALLADLYRRGGVHILNAPMDQFKVLLERNEILLWYCLSNFSDVAAAKKLVAYSPSESVRKVGQDFLKFLKTGIVDSAYSAMEGLMIVAGALVGSLALFKLASTVIAPKGRPAPIQRGSTQASAYLDMQKITRAKKLDKRRERIEARKVHLQSNEVFMTGAVIAARSQWQLQDNDGTVTNMLALGGRDFVFNNHTAKKLEACVKQLPKERWSTLSMAVINGDKTYKVPVTELLDGYAIDACDTYWVRLPSMPECKDITAHWVGDGFVEGIAHEGQRRIALSSMIVGKGLQTNAAKLIAGRTVEDRYVSMLWGTEMNTTGGDCGSACFVATQGPNQGKICGILQSGEEGMGLAYFCAISRHTMLEMRARLSGYEPKLHKDGKKMVIGQSPTPHNFSSRVSDMLVPSENPAKEPFKASVDVSDPEVYAMARRKYCPGFKPETHDMIRLSECMDEQLRFFREHELYPVKSGFKTFHEAIVGNDGTAFKGVPLGTSPGAPFNVAAFSATKAELLGTFEDGKFIYGPRSQEIMDRVGQSLEHLLRGEVPLDMFTDIVKAETLPASKVAKKKGRIVSSCSIVRTLVARMIYGNFFEWLTANHLTNGISAGDNMLGKDADIIVRQHLAMAAGENTHFAGDLSANDARQVGAVLVMAVQRWNNFLRVQGCFDEVQYRIAETFAKSYLHQFHVRGGEIDMWDGSLSSGDPCTSPLNSFCNGSYCRFSVWRKMDFPGGDWHDEFNKNIKSNYLGDDNFHTVSPKWKHLVNEQVMADGYACFGHVYTNDAKDGLNSDLRPIEQITYLKRSPRFEPLLSRWTMVLDLDTVLEIGLWTTMDGKDGMPNMDQALTNLDTMTRELCFHDDDVWEYWIPRYIKMYEEYDWYPKYLDRKSMLYYVTGERGLHLA